ncbi:MAG TPA: hypothetical protein VI197_16665 [Polyangiaceae bacterium]
MVAATAANRALTGECWAACTPGHVCDHESGLCVPGECSPACPDTQTCVRIDGVLMCADKGTTWASNMQGNTFLPSGGAPAKARAAPAGAAGSVPLASAPASACAIPGSAEWYQEQAEAPSTEPAGALARDFVGLWSVVGSMPRSGDDAPRPLVVTLEWFGRSPNTATGYRARSEAGALLELEVWSDAAPARTPLSVEFLSSDRLRLHGVEYQREDCARADAHPSCCALPRASWVRLGPSQGGEPQPSSPP